MLRKEKDAITKHKEKMKLRKQDLILKNSTIKALQLQQDNFIKQIADLQITNMLFQNKIAEQSKSIEIMTELQKQIDSELKGTHIEGLGDKSELLKEIADLHTTIKVVDTKLTQHRVHSKTIIEYKDNRDLLKENSILLKKIEYISSLYQLSISKSAAVNVTLQVSERKIEKKQLRIQDLENKLLAVNQVLNSSNAYIQQIGMRLKKYESIDLGAKPMISDIILHAKCVKSIAGSIYMI